MNPKNIYHFLLAYLGAIFYNFPSKKLTVVGVTGTNGKTTTVHLLYHILNSSGIKAGMVSSLQFCVGTDCKRNLLKMTMPGRFRLQKFFRECLEDGITHAVIEVTSQGVLQHRHRAIKFDYAVLTNVTPEHIEAHGSFEKYLSSKLKFFEYAAQNPKAMAVVNADDPRAELFLGYSFNKKIKYRASEFKYRSSLSGDFNKANLMAAVKVAESLGFTESEIKSSLESFPGVPGRLEFIQREPFAVIVDYAHTPDALKKVYTFLSASNSKFPAEGEARQRRQIPNSKLICVLGAAGGGRDKWKRPEMGKIAAEFCDEIVLTNEDPYDENPEAILDDIVSGFSQIPNSKSQFPNKPQIQIFKILNRRDAIRKAISDAKPGDTVIITGKGAEPWIMGPAGSKIPWDDRTVVREELEKSSRE